MKVTVREVIMKKELDRFETAIVSFLENSEDTHQSKYNIAWHLHGHYLMSIHDIYEKVNSFLSKNRKIFVKVDSGYALRSRVNKPWGATVAKDTVVPLRVYQALSPHDKIRARHLRVSKQLESLSKGTVSKLRIPELFETA